jgi:hypothetical protein
VAIEGQAMSGDIFRPRSRPTLRFATAIAIFVLLTSAAGVGVYLRANVVPPDCANPATLTLVRHQLSGRFHLPSSVILDNIQTHAGGYFAFRFACEASLSGIDAHDLPPGSPIPGSVTYVSQLTQGGSHHEVTVRIYPLLILEKVQ